ncbi:MAG: hypothetical protein IPK26_30205 [Planctomycetes bacterium]|nr:hypothetical protein [Planctomycetota bacterium]
MRGVEAPIDQEGDLFEASGGDLVRVGHRSRHLGDEARDRAGSDRARCSIAVLGIRLGNSSAGMFDHANETRRHSAIACGCGQPAINATSVIASMTAASRSRRGVDR